MKESESMSSTVAQRLFSAVAAAAVLAAGTTAVAADWGTVKGKFVYKGDVKPEKIVPSKDTEFCSKHELVDESIIVGDKGGLANVFVFLNPGRDKKVEVHPDIKPSSEPKILDNHGCRFEPHAMTLWTEESLEVRNSDEGLAHNTNASFFFSNPTFNETVPNGSPLKKKFTKSEAYPSKVVCNIHPWMLGYVFIRDNPYMALSAEDGSFEIANVPAGKQTFGFWHEEPGNLKQLKIGKDKADRKGQFELNVPAGGTLDLGEIEVTPVVLGK